MEFGKTQLDNSIKLADSYNANNPTSENINERRILHDQRGLVYPNSLFHHEIDSGNISKLNASELAFFPEYTEQRNFMPLGSEDKVDNLFRLGKVQELLSYPPYYSVVGSSLIGQRANDQIEESRENRINVAIDNLIKERDDNNVNPMSKTLD
jgi:hypothetical protein